MTAVLALLASDRVDDVLVEFLRIAVGVVAAGGDVTLAEAGPARGRLTEEDGLPDEAVRYLQALAECGVGIQQPDAESLLAALGAHGPLVRLGADDRSGDPPVLRVDDDWLAQAVGREGEALQEILDAGQVVRC